MKKRLPFRPEDRRPWRVRHLGMLLSLLLILPISATAQVGQWAPGAVNYQGQLIQEDGTPLSQGSYKLTVTIHDALLGGNLKWGPYVFDGGSGNGHASKVFVGADGRFNVVLGERDTADRRLVDAMQVSATEGRFIELQVGTDAPMRPRQRFLSAPYVIQAATATRIADMLTTDNLNYGIGITPEARLDVNGDVRIRGNLKADTVKVDHLNVERMTVTTQLAAGNTTITGNLQVNGTITGGFQNITTTQFTLTYPAGQYGITSQPIPNVDTASWFCALANVEVTGNADPTDIYGCNVQAQTDQKWLLFINRAKVTYNVICTANCFKFK